MGKWNPIQQDKAIPPFSKVKGLFWNTGQNREGEATEGY
jgi:hypothetical protein